MASFVASDCGGDKVINIAEFNSLKGEFKISFGTNASFDVLASAGVVLRSADVVLGPF